MWEEKLSFKDEYDGLKDILVLNFKQIMNILGSAFLFLITLFTCFLFLLVDIPYTKDHNEKP